MPGTILKSASLRLTLYVAGLITLVSLGALAVQYFEVRAEFTRRITQDLDADIAGYSAFYDQRRIVSLRQALEYHAALDLGFEQVFLLQDKQHQFLGGNIRDWPETLVALGEDFRAAQPQIVRISTPDGQTADYVAIARNLPGGFPFLAARSLAPRDRMLAQMRRSFLWVGLGLAGLGIAAGFAVSRHIIGRIERVNALADRVAAGEVSARLPGPAAADEFGRLQGHVHAMLDRIEALQHATYRLSDAIAHELRTPLNRIRQKLDQFTGQEALVEDLQQEMTGAIRVFDALLDIASAEAASGTAPSLPLVDLSAICENVFQLYEPLAEDRSLEFSRQIAPKLSILGDSSLIAQLVSNLVDNALKFTRAGDQVSLMLDAAGASARLIIRDTGPGLPEGMKDRIFERFTRAERDHDVAGHGLGLALVKAIATRHGAKISVLPTERGFAVEILCPMVTALPHQKSAL